MWFVLVKSDYGLFPPLVQFIWEGLITAMAVGHGLNNYTTNSLRLWIWSKQTLEHLICSLNMIQLILLIDLEPGEGCIWLIPYYSFDYP